MHRYQRRRASGVDSHAGSLNTEHVRQASRRRAQGVSNAEIGINVCEVAGTSKKQGIVVGTDPYEHAGSAAGEFVGRLRGMFESFPTYLEEQALLRVHAEGFT